MKISDIHSAKGSKFKLTFVSEKRAAVYPEDALIDISKTGANLEFYVERYGQDTITCFADKLTADYINDLLQHREIGAFRCLFAVESANNDGIVVQAYTFRSVTEYKTPLEIKVSEKVLIDVYNCDLDRPKGEFVWNGTGYPAIFVLNYKNSAKKKGMLRLLSGKRFMQIQDTARGLIVSEVNYAKDRTYLPIDVYIAPSIEFVKEADAAGVNDEFASDIERISVAATYFARWEAYNELAEREIKNRAEEFGKIRYDGVKRIPDANGTSFEFNISEDIFSDHKGSDIKVFANDEAYKIRAGEIEKVSDNILVTYRRDAETIAPVVPDSGVIVLSIDGDMAVINRRNLAKERMLQWRSPIRFIVGLIEKGVSEFGLDSNWEHHKAVTSELKRHFEKAEYLNTEQQKALEIAINTPDIALIQGPPGTGKTTVIAAICERFREIFEKKEREKEPHDPGYTVQRPKILISSFQNEAVDNAVSNPQPGDLPANRIGNKEIRERFQKRLDGWFDDVKEKLEIKAEGSASFAFAEQKRKLTDDFFVYKSTGESIDTAVGIIKKYLSFERIYPEELERTAKTIVAEHQKQKYDLANNDVEDPVIEKIRAQRLTRQAFADDGANNARRLATHLKNRGDLNIPQSDIDAVLRAGTEAELDDAVFAKYAETVKKFKAKFCPVEERVDLSNKAKIEKCILELAHAFTNGNYLATDDLEAKKAFIIGEFLDSFENEYRTLVEKYSLTTAATCQASLPRRGVNTEIDYDLVIVDEAARANPLDLFIPMSMGRKIVLVGDQKQLPHTLEPEVLKLILEDSKFKDLPGIEKSLFERLYGMCLTGLRPKAIMLNTQYRMHPDICEFVSEQFYDSELKTAQEITADKRKIPRELFGGKALAFTNIPINRGAESGRASKSRHEEVRAVVEDIRRIFEVEPKCREGKIGAITFYQAQAKLLRDEIEKALNAEQFACVEIGTVDAFQGKEFDYVLLSCVRSNNIKGNGEEQLKKSVGFLTKKNRTCVAFSRAKRQLSVYGDAETLNRVSYFKALYEKCRSGKGGGYYREY
jgi:hypothetical protein